ncbi:MULTISPECIES: Holliday junction resolvase RuvX [unclassified Bosea (in: a-proteobacteria)]|uniref:Holliday junction resolvase RuvX n=1 Tax=unclassified Bosea (in: a-proteobacteria) TaxID=2653178 RepID=UPI000F75A352|nr:MULTISPECIES: Holliday junction resolvase RuvX [unclassified Bosea (in: a-proteobacteria)]AZO77336.1 Holliday junction DNA helicase RuvA [Bosea sp. Tri-49]RXT22195.1 Holliday junction resolvase RuvX [Bosea sp. Tri-39]RXT32537.1 Holliday junction resolvase RuvX [Bosea sp. Tri-54]
MSANLVTLEQFLALPEQARLLGLDLGTKTIGLALSDVERRIATPLETIQRVKFKQDVVALLKVTQKHAIAGLVIGLPLNMDGSEGPRVQSTRAFVRNLAPLTALPIVFWDERMSTLAVTRTLLDADASRARRAAVVDKMAAAYILQGALDRLARLESDGNESEEDWARGGSDQADEPDR